MLEVRLLGTFTIKCDGKPVTISSRAAQSLFAYLILNAGTSHRREKLAGMVWPDATEEKAHAYLRHELWRLRKALSSKSKVDYLVADAIHISFNSSSDYWSDISELKNANEAASIEELMEVLSVAQGELLPGFYDEWIILERQYLQAIYEKRMARLLEWLEHEKRWSSMLEWAERWISLGQGPEAAYRALMIAYDGLEDRTKVASTYQRCVVELRKLDLEPSDQTRALAFKRNSSLNIPIPLTSFIGREKELKEVAALLSKSRLVTLTGSGGVGKTRLAIQAVANVLELFPDGTWFLDLAPLSDPVLVPNTLASLIGLQESADAKLSITNLLIDYLRSRTTLVIFDNCEHLIDACARLVNSLLTSCEGLSILATSRETLRVSGEIPYRVPSLEIPLIDAEIAVNQLVKKESVKLFMERAVVASPGFAIDSRNAFSIAKICRRLDGIPLAIELAAVRTNLLTPEQIVKRLDDRFDLLTGGSRSALPRHKTLRATIEWSYDLLSENERHLFRRLAVFRGGWTLEAAEEVCSGGGIGRADVLDLLSQLVNKSLVLSETVEGAIRYHRLETMRQLAREKLFETDEVEQLHDRHLDYFLKRAEDTEPYLQGPEQSVLMDDLESDLDNFRLALERSISNKRGDESFRLFGALASFWYVRCHFLEAVEWFQRAYKLRETASKSALAKALRHAGSLYFIQENFSASRSVLMESLDLFRELGDRKEISTGLQFMGVLETGQGDFVRARPLLEEGLMIGREVNNRPAIIRALIHLAYISRIEGNYIAAAQQYEEGLEICRQTQDSHLTWLVLQDIGTFVLIQKNYTKAREYYEEALSICLKAKNKRAVAYSLLDFANLFCAEVRNTESALLQGFGLTLLNELGFITQTELRESDQMAAELKITMGEGPYQKAFNTGKTLWLEQAVEIALKQKLISNDQEDS